MGLFDDLIPPDQETIFRGLLDRGLSPAQAAGFMGNFSAESGYRTDINERNPVVPGSRGGYGLYQATGPRRVALERLAAERGVAPSDLDTQLDQIMRELQGPESKAMRALQNTATPAEAARAVESSFLRPGVPSTNRRVAEAERVMAAYGQPQAQTSQPQAQTSGMFDDLIPQKTAAPTSTGGMFDDLIPKLEAVDPTDETRTGLEKPPTGLVDRYRQMVGQATGDMAAGARRFIEGMRTPPDPNAPTGWFGIKTTGGKGVTEALKGAGQAGVGAVDYVSAPANAAVENLATNLQESAGIPENVTRAGAILATPGIGTGQAVRNLVRRAEFPRVTGDPTHNQLKEAYVSAAHRKEVENVQIRPEAMRRELDAAGQMLAERNFSPVKAPRSYAILENSKAQVTPSSRFQMEGLTGAGRVQSEVKPVGMSQLDDTDDWLNAVISGSDRQDSRAAELLKERLHNWTPAKDDMISGNYPLARQIMDQADRNYAVMKSSEALTNRISAADRAAARSNSGLNATNVLRQRVDSFLYNSKGELTTDGRKLPQNVRQELENFVRGSTSANALRYAGNLLGGGGGLGTLTTGGFAGLAAGPAGLALPAAGFGLRLISNATTRKEANKLAELIRAQSPLGQQMRAAVTQWERAAKRARQSGPNTTQATKAVIASQLAIQSRNLANNLADAGIDVSPSDLANTALPERQ